ncbi:MAG: serine/threonine protein kinase [Candidatus Riflebacteria bacterium]|nr:serine/threonine protein kinase [Candidatus Riflebacteria bacterium]
MIMGTSSSRDEDGPPELRTTYRIERELGRGAFGTVYLATQVALDRPVALKIMLPDAALTGADPRVRFVNEARMVASLDHPNIVKVLDQGETGGALWIAYEYLAGRTLREIIETGRMAVPLAVDAGVQIASAVDAAHLQGILHRDLKPENVLESSPGCYKVTDFGIAKWLKGASYQTATGLILGTPAYLAPELIDGAPADRPSDVYALGVLLFELVSGRQPFVGDSIAEILTCHVMDAPPALADLCPGVPVELEAIVSRALAKEPADRFPTAGHLAEALGRLALPGAHPVDEARPAAGARGPAPRRAPVKALATAVEAGSSRPEARLPDRRRRSSPWSPRTGVALACSAAALALVVAAVAIRGPGSTDRAGRPASLLVPDDRLDPTPQSLVVSVPSILSTRGGAATTLSLRLVQLDYSGPVRVVIPGTAGSIGATMAVTAPGVARALLKKLQRLPAALAWAGDRVAVADLSQRVRKLRESSGGASRVGWVLERGRPELVALWRTAAAHSRQLLQSRELPVDLRGQLLSHLYSLQDLSCRFKVNEIPVPVEMGNAFPPSCGPGWFPLKQSFEGREIEVRIESSCPNPIRPVDIPIAIAGAATPIGVAADLVPGLGDAVASVVPGHLLVASTDLTGERLAPESLLAQLMVRPGDPMAGKRLDGRWRGTFALPPAWAPGPNTVAWVGTVRVPGTRRASIRITINGRFTVRPGGPYEIRGVRRIRSYHTFDPAILVAGRNTLEITAVRIGSFDSLPFSLADRAFVVVSSRSPASQSPVW